MKFKKALTREELETLVKPQLRLFMSVDVVDSTALKHGSREENPAKPWLPFILGFYTGFPGMFSEHFGKVLAMNGTETKLREPYLWKACGDELIFCVLLEHPGHLRFYLKAFRLALIDAIKNWAKGGDPPLPINFKGTAWLAGFPVFNTAVPIEAPASMTEHSEHFDFVGPLIDIGFRLAKFATPRKFVVSADIAWIVTRFGDMSGLDFYYDGREKFKGVLNGISYPVIWVDCQDDVSDAHSLEGIEDRLLGRDVAKTAVIAELAKAYLDSVQDFLPKPFFHGLKDIDPEFKAPAGFDDLLKAAQAQLERIYMPDFSAEDDIPTKPKQSNAKAIKDLLARLEEPVSPKKNAPRKKRS